MNKKCIGCGIELQTVDPNQVGYIKDQNYENALNCERCFRIKHYSDYKIINADNDDFIKILKDINTTNDLVVLVIDLFNINENFDIITNNLKNDVLLVLTKRDLLPLSLKDHKLLNYIDNLKIKYKDKIVISSSKNYNLDDLITKIENNKKSNRVYIVGFTNAGKSTLINKLTTHYGIDKSDITTSILPSTTLNCVEIKLNNTLTLIDTPGLLDKGNIINFIDIDTLKTILPKKEIKPTTYQVKTKQSFIVEKLFRLDTEKGNITFFISNQLKMERVYKEKLIEENFECHELNVNKNEDLVIFGLGFIKFTENANIKLYTIKGVKVFTRPSLIG